MGKKKSEKSGKSSKKSKENGKELPNFHNGFGEFTLPNGDMYIGEYCAHRSGIVWRQGYGIYKTQDNQYYEGEWNDDKLVENKEIIITYPNGAQYYGCLLKNKYNGPATYALEQDMSLSCQFVANKPTGTITLIDREGKCWSGVARENSAILLPENIFYLNLNNYVGKGVSKEPLPDMSMFDSKSACSLESEVELSDREWEQIIFAKSTLTEDDVDFTDCKWWKDFDKFKFRYNEIKQKIDDNSSLDEDDRAWIRNFRKYKRMKKLEKVRKEQRVKEERDHVFALNEIYRSQDFLTSSPAVKVFYPRKNWDPTYERNSDEDSELSATDSKNVIASGECPAKGASASGAQLSKNDPSLISDEQTMLFNELVRSSTELFKRLHSLTETELHFTPFREQMLIEKKLEMAEEMKRALEKEATRKSSETSKSKETLDGSKKVSKTDMKQVKSVENVVIDRKKKIENRVKECVGAYLEEREKKMEQRREIGVEKEVDAVHTHDVAAHTESIDGIPLKYLLDT